MIFVDLLRLYDCHASLVTSTFATKINHVKCSNLIVFFGLTAKFGNGFTMKSLLSCATIEMFVFLSNISNITNTTYHYRKITSNR